MKVVDPGHVYELTWLDVVYLQHDEGQNRLIFVKREGEKYPGNVGHHPGTTMQEVLRVLIDRLKYVNSQEPDGRNEYALAQLRMAIFALELRAAERHKRVFSYDANRIEEAPTCNKCGHIGCEGACH